MQAQRSSVTPTSQTLGCVYLAFCSLNGTGYIGKSVHGLDQRRKSHSEHAANGRKTRFCSALRKYGLTQFTWTQLYVSPSDAALLAAEVSLIATYKAAGVRLYNMTTGGDGTAGLVCAPQTKKLLSEGAVKRCADPAERVRMSQRASKHWQDPAKRAEMSQHQLRRFADPAERAKMSARAVKRFTDPAERAKLSKRTTEHLADPAARAKVSARQTKRYQDPAERALQSVRASKAWAARKGLRYCKYRKSQAYHPLTP